MTSFNIIQDEPPTLSETRTHDNDEYTYSTAGDHHSKDILEDLTHVTNKKSDEKITNGDQPSSTITKPNSQRFNKNEGEEDEEVVVATTTTTTTKKTGIAPNKRDSRPKIRWAQSDTQITLQIHLTRVKDYDISIQDSGAYLEFSAQLQDTPGRGRNNEYYFSLDLYANVNEQKYYCYRLKKYLLLVLEKVSPGSKWPRLTSDDSNNHSRWLEHCGENIDGWNIMHGLSDHQNINNPSGSESRKLDDENDEYDDDDEDEDPDGIIGGEQRFEELKRQIEQAKKLSRYNQVASALTSETAELSATKTTTSEHQEEKQTRIRNSDKIIHKNSDIKTDIFNPFNRRHRFTNTSNNMKYDYRKGTVTTDTSKNTAKYALDCKKTYLFIYNLIMFIMFLMVYIILIIKTVTKTIDDDSVRGAAFLIKLLTYTQLVESIHPMLGLVPGGPFMPFLQAMGRLLVNHFLADPVIRMNSAPNAHYLFVVWSSIEIFRYSFYALRVFKVEIYPLTWCRYTLFMPLYPMGGFFESQIIMATIKQYQKTGAMSISLPNSSNFSFNMPIFLKIYTYALLGPSIFYLMKYMWSQRCKQLAPKKEKCD